MSQGLRVWNASGVLVLDITDRLTRIHGTYSANLSSVYQVEISVPGCRADGTWAVFCTNGARGRPETDKVVVFGSAKSMILGPAIGAITVTVLRY